MNNKYIWQFYENLVLRTCLLHLHLNLFIRYILPKGILYLWTLLCLSANSVKILKFKYTRQFKSLCITYTVVACQQKNIAWIIRILLDSCFPISNWQVWFYSNFLNITRYQSPLVRSDLFFISIYFFVKSTISRSV